MVHEGPRRTPLFVHEGPRRTAKGRGEHLFLSTKGHEGPRRDAKNTSFYPRRATKDHEGPRRTPLFIHEGPRRTTKNSSFIHEGHEGSRRAAENTVCGRRSSWLQATRIARETAQFARRFPVLSQSYQSYTDVKDAKWIPVAGNQFGGDGAWFWRGALRGRSPCTRKGACAQPPGNAVFCF